ncbi:50S ribosomal protein L11 methyltransferase [Desulfobotulus sp. H1]|uniref:50S ribosomal protein L11 methyltransferase n=1 Tax=Desulfobotulus pelophilus TaxID=2823377 RepID=A0ABT3NCP1_9BACT|nr:50S ribosomal protein L11 methyltransferase [Desulfobotulus pelophilus]MCW7755233.1 50S ribosomal protein L11 methyltransferase [Desulfobotulus pelophilus]
MESAALAEYLLERVGESEESCTPAELVRLIVLETALPRRVVQQALAALIEGGDLAYLIRHGRTCVQRGWHSPLPVGRSTQLLVPGVKPLAGSRQPVVLMPGDSFGGGDHPTTRLCLEWIEEMAVPGGRMLDVGTGTGVLAISAVRHGMAEALGVDNDPVAVNDALENVRLNGLDASVVISDVWPDNEKWDLVAANLRPPTLMALKVRLDESLIRGGVLVLSGMRAEEMDPLQSSYGQSLHLVGRRQEKGWGSLVFRKKACP